MPGIEGDGPFVIPGGVGDALKLEKDVAPEVEVMGLLPGAGRLLAVELKLLFFLRVRDLAV